MDDVFCSVYTLRLSSSEFFSLLGRTGARAHGRSDEVTAAATYRAGRANLNTPQSGQDAVAVCAMNIPMAESTSGELPTRVPRPFTSVSIGWPRSSITATARAAPTIMATTSTLRKPSLKRLIVFSHDLIPRWTAGDQCIRHNQKCLARPDGVPLAAALPGPNLRHRHSLVASSLRVPAKACGTG